MSHKPESAGVLPGPTAIKGVAQEDLIRLTYRTTYSTGVAGRIPAAEDKGENFSNVHAIGRKDTKYMKFQKSTAPLLDRSACSQRRDFVELPLGDNVVNNALAASFAGGLKAGKKGLKVEFSSATAYSENFAGYDPERTAGAKQKSAKVKNGRTSTITGMTDLMETKPLSHSSFRAPNAELAKAAEIVLAKPNLGLMNWQGDAEHSSYKREFCSMKRNASAPMMSLADVEVGRTDDLLPGDHPGFSVRRACFLSPGQ
eukprot:TRINITY_DN51198_c0_g1_i1.p1 TRINITY_DN51198_c0_g1~~TRINITY_DN51198_c0_g1_i1.p1  ORF type:complete len:281 (-),score=56.38 TRINITY_DN51198_c0_g1_i1:105-875(-)